ncbi:tetratricopeptide repeat protein [Yinghuangia soli]|uniref:Tetratricopeptide repeat protein n=1 Tax=Yinghuangia soli TaxID=2908204 RepID=A0AA41QA08_9ACTN|nr:tetratricopeptide repeat protein [Yinghuangia soli]MCF2533981.1 tetratricopeptide repeat protein [Yinghuangia soli]
MDLRRVVEVWCRHGQFSTGYLVADGLVLTSYHGVGCCRPPEDVPPGSIQVRALEPVGKTDWVPGDVCWPPHAVDAGSHRELDVALIRLAVGVVAAESGVVPPVRFGRITGPDRVAADGVGFPDAEVRQGSTRRDSMPVRGHIDPAHGVKSGLLTLKVDVGIVPSRTGTSGEHPWKGVSGTAVFCGDLLVGVVAVDRRLADTASVLSLVPVFTLPQLDGFTEHFAACTVADVGSANAAASPRFTPGGGNLPTVLPDVFVGRDAEMAALCGVGTAGVVVITQTVHGLAGIGKSTLALCYAIGQMPGRLVSWRLTADTPEHITAGLAELARYVGAGPPTAPVEEAARHAKSWLGRHGGWLLIVDNAPHPAALGDLLHGLHKQGEVVITTRFAGPWPGATVELEPLPPEASVDLLAAHANLRGAESRDELRLLADELGHLPLALVHAGAFIGEAAVAVSDYLAGLRSAPGEILDIEHPDEETGALPPSVARTLRITVKHIHRTNAEAGRLLSRLAWFAPEAIPRSLAAIPGQSAVQAAQAVRLLRSYSMVNLSDDGSIGMHRLVQLLLRTPGPDDPLRSPDAVALAQAAAGAAVAAAAPEGGRPEPASWPTWRALLPHIDALARRSDASDVSVPLAGVFGNAAVFADDQGLIEDAVRLATAGWTCLVHHLGEQAPETLSARNNMAGAIDSAGRLYEALPIYEANLADRVRLHGPGHPATCHARHNLAYAYENSGRLDEAIRLFEENLELRRRALDPDDTDLIAAADSLAGAYESRGDYDRAIELYLSTLAEAVERHGAEHPRALVTRNNLAYTYESIGRLDLAVPLYEETLRLRRKVLGEKHPYTLMSRNNLAVAYRGIGRVAEAHDELDALLADNIRILGVDHPDNIVYRSNLARVIAASGEWTHALPVFEENADEAVRVLGDAQIPTILARKYLAQAYLQVGRAEEGRTLLDAVYADAQRFLGEDHPLVTGFHGSDRGAAVAED